MRNCILLILSFALWGWTSELAASPESNHIVVFEVIGDTPIVARRELDRERLGLEGQGPGFIDGGGAAGFFVQLALQAAINHSQKSEQFEAANAESLKAGEPVTKELSLVKPSELISEVLQRAGRDTSNVRRVKVTQELWFSSDLRGIRLSFITAESSQPKFAGTVIRALPSPLLLPDGSFNNKFSARHLLHRLYQDMHDLYHLWSADVNRGRLQERTLRSKYGDKIFYERGSLLGEWCYRHAYVSLTDVLTMTPKDSEMNDSNLCDARFTMFQ